MLLEMTTRFGEAEGTDDRLDVIWSRPVFG
jgi:hypothetical protein